MSRLKVMQKTESSDSRESSVAARIQTACYIIFLVIGVLYLIGSLLLPIGTSASPQGGLFPLLVAIFLIAMSIILILGFLRCNHREVQPIEVFPEGKDRKRVLALACALILYSILLKPFGYLISTIALMAAVSHLLGLRGWVMVALAATLTGVLSYFLFAFILDVPLPRGEVFS
jgi:putative tricarboxylic transport membrane protein